MSRPTVPHRAVFSLDLVVLLRLSWLDIFKPDSELQCPCRQGAADVFRAVVASHCLGLAAPFDHLIQCPNNPLRGQRQVDLYCQPFTIEVIQHVKQAIVSAILKLVVHEVHRPTFIDCMRRRQWFRLLPDDPFLRLDSQVSADPSFNWQAASKQPWQAKHLVSRIGRTSSLKLTVSCVGSGSTTSSSGVSVPSTQPNRNNAVMNNVVSIRAIRHSSCSGNQSQTPIPDS